MLIAICDDCKADAEKIRFSLMDITDGNREQKVKGSDFPYTLTSPFPKRFTTRSST